MDADTIIRLTISEAAKLFGVNQQTVRRALSDGELTYVIVQGRYKINFESLLKWSQRRMTVHNKMNERGIGQYIEKWRIKNTLFSPNPKLVEKARAKRQAKKNPPSSAEPEAVQIQPAPEKIEPPPNASERPTDAGQWSTGQTSFL